MDFDCYRVATGSGITVTVATSTTAYTMPASQVSLDAASGRSSSPRFVRVLPEANVYINFGTSPAVTCGTGGGPAGGTPGILVSPNMPEVFNVAGFPYFAVIAKTATVVSVTPVEV